MNLLYLFLLILIIYIIAYAFAYPKFVKDNVTKFFIGDTIVSIASVILIGFRFWETGEEFDFYLFKSNWFVATLICQAVAESILIYFYNKRYNVLKDMGKPPESKPPESKPPESKPPESKPPESKPPESKPPESKPE